MNGSGLCSLSPGRQYEIGRDKRCDVVLDEFTISRRHCSLTPGNNGLWVLQDNNSRFGTFVNGKKITRAVLRDADIIRLGQILTIRYSANTLAISDQGVAGGVTVELDGTEVLSPRGSVLVGPITARIEGGSFTAVLGPSGSGKSTLIKAIAGIVDVANPRSILLDGRERGSGPDDLQNNGVGLVMQSDFLYSRLTVAEMLLGAAELRLNEQSKEQQREAVKRVLDNVSLEHKSTDLVMGLSGGEKKRVSIAIGLLRKPRLLILDEPTSGLDPSTQLRVISLLRKLARQGMTVLCTTHALETLPYFDQVLVLAKVGRVGELAFHGPSEGLKDAFGVRNYADLFDRLSAGTISETGRESATGISDRSVGAEDGPAEPVSGYSATSSLLDDAVLYPFRALFTEVGLGTSFRVSYVRQFKQYLRDRTNLVMGVGLPFLLAVIVAFTQQNQSRTVFSIFFLVISGLWLGMTITVRDLVRYRNHYAIDRVAGLTPGGFLLANLANAMTMLLWQTAILAATAFVLLPVLIRPEHGLASKLPGFPLLFSLLFLSGIFGAVIGLIVSSLSRTEQQAVSWLPLIIIPQMLLSRVAYGDADKAWFAVEDIVPLRLVTQGFLIPGQLFSEMRDDWAVFWDFLIFGASLVVASRPLTSVLDIPNQVEPEFRELGEVGVTAWQYSGEIFHLALLLLIHVGVLCLVFYRAQKRWRPKDRLSE